MEFQRYLGRTISAIEWITAAPYSDGSGRRPHLAPVLRFTFTDGSHLWVDHSGDDMSYLFLTGEDPRSVLETGTGTEAEKA